MRASNARCRTCENCGADFTIHDVEVDYCDSCDYLDRRARGEFECTWVDEATNHERRANALAELRERADKAKAVAQ